MVLGGAGGLFYLLGGDAPSEVDLEAAAAAVTTDAPADPSVATTAGPTTVATDLEGIWSVDTTVGEFSVTEDTAATFAGFRVNEVLDAIGETVAVGRTAVVSGTLEIVGTELESVSITADLTAIVSDRARRENAIQRALNTSANPEAMFVLTEPVDIGEGAASGETVSGNANGDLTINGITMAVAIPIEARLVDGLIIVTGSTDVTFADYGVATPSAPIVLSLEDQGILEFQLWFSK